MNDSQKLLSDIAVYTKYAKYIPLTKKRESWTDITDRYIEMLIKAYGNENDYTTYELYHPNYNTIKDFETKFSKLVIDIIYNSKYLYDKDCLPSMRALQFAGPAIEKNHSRGYNCFSQETKFITSYGVKSFADFKAGDKTYVLTHTGQFKKATIKSYGKQNLNKVTFKKGRSEKIIKVTGNHRWILKDSSSTTSLKTGDILHKAPDFISDFEWDNASPVEKLSWCYGFVYGDGTLTKNSKGEYTHSLVRLCGNDIKYLYRFEEMGFKSSSSMSLKGDIIVYTGKYLKTLPEITYNNFEELRSFVIGYLDADGYKNTISSNRVKYKGIQASGEESIDFIEKAFEVCSMYITSFDDLTNEETNYGIRPYTKRFRMNHVISKYSNAMWSVSKIEDSVIEEEVWCLEVEDDHSFVLSGGLVTGNCAYLPIDHYAAFSETMFLLLGGTGVGFSVQNHHVEKLPEITQPTNEKKFLINDSIEGWADAIKALMKAYMGKSKYKPRFDFSDIRSKGSRLVTAGGKAPGPEPLRICLTKIESKLRELPNGHQLSPIEAHDIICYIADAVLAGGIRRAALISLFTHDNKEMLTAKAGAWWELNPQRGRANNSAVMLRNRASKQNFENLWGFIKDSGAGEPGIYWTNDPEYGTNPCCEISLRSNTFCNLTEINAGNLKNQEDFNNRAKVCAFFGTLQAGLTDFHYLRPIWKKNTEKDSLIGVGITGICNGTIYDLNLKQASEIVKIENERVSKIIGINMAARTTTVKPSGTTSCVVGTSSGIHAWHSKYYIRNMQCSIGDDLYNFFTTYYPRLITHMERQAGSAVIGIPQMAPANSTLRENETAIDFLERVNRFNIEWVKNGHNRGPNTNNVSATCNVKTNEWDDVGEWMWKNKKNYNGLAVLPYDDHSYKNAPFEECTKEQYDELTEYINSNPINLTLIVEEDDNTDLSGEIACGGGACDITY